jgi:hypothetical protein
MATLLKILPNGEYEFKEGGARSEAIKWDEETNKPTVMGYRPTVGCSMLVGSVTARSYSDRDYWLTTEVLEILEETEDIVKFKTKNSIYEWRS